MPPSKEMQVVVVPATHSVETIAASCCISFDLVVTGTSNMLMCYMHRKIHTYNQKRGLINLHFGVHLGALVGFMRDLWWRMFECVQR
jgi:hypothetical protein